MTNTPAEVSPTIDLEVLERLAREATPGPWNTDPDMDHEFVDAVVDGGYIADCTFMHRQRPAKSAKANGQYIAAANPQVVAALVAAVKAARAYASANSETELPTFRELEAALKPFTVTK